MKKLILISLLASGLFADYCNSYLNLMDKESQKGLQYYKNGLYDMACYQVNTSIMYAVNAKVECENKKEIVKSIDELINSMKMFKKAQCK